jgi:hypothetical protein
VENDEKSVQNGKAATLSAPAGSQDVLPYYCNLNVIMYSSSAAKEALSTAKGTSNTVIRSLFCHREGRLS